ncbi:MAG: DUF3224 domain-containing protein [Trueperaceae bacterium]
MSTATGTFEIEMTPAASGIHDAVGRFDFTKTFRGDLEAASVGIMLSAGAPEAGEAGYVAMEAVEGRLNGLVGGFALQHFGTLHGGKQALEYVVVPGSGHGSLTSITGTVHLTIDDTGAHRYTLDYEI